ncbi:MAG: hypothetical protein ACQEQJ_08690 [Halobacteriota archaeon]
MSDSSGSPGTVSARPSGIYALIAVSLLYLFSFSFDPAGTRAALDQSLAILGRIAPVLVGVTVLVGLSKYALGPQVVARYVGAESGWLGYLLAALGGLLSHGPVYAWYALLRDFQAEGMRNGLIAVFLYNRAIKLPLLPLFLVYFEVEFAVVLGTVMIVVSAGQGFIVDRLVPN